MRGSWSNLRARKQPRSPCTASQEKNGACFQARVGITPAWSEARTGFASITQIISPQASSWHNDDIMHRNCQERSLVVIPREPTGNGQLGNVRVRLRLLRRSGARVSWQVGTKPTSKVHGVRGKSLILCEAASCHLWSAMAGAQELSGRQSRETK